jgi:hypothetical protein
MSCPQSRFCREIRPPLPGSATDLTAGRSSDKWVHVYSVATRAQLNKLDCGLAFSEITLYWLLQEMRRVAAQQVYFYQPIGGWFWNSPRMSMESHSGMILTGENWITQIKSCPSATLSKKNPTWTDPGVNLGLCGQRLATKSPSYCIAWLCCYLLCCFCNRNDSCINKGKMNHIILVYSHWSRSMSLLSTDGV